jgi:hypothetical protein
MENKQRESSSVRSVDRSVARSLNRRNQGFEQHEEIEMMLFACSSNISLISVSHEWFRDSEDKGYLGSQAYAMQNIHTRNGRIHWAEKAKLVT